MRVLVTRPDPASRRTAQLLADLGHAPVLLPLFETRFVEVDPNILNGDWAALVFTSANAVKAVGGAFVSSNPPVYTVGGATAHAARGFGYTDIRAGTAGGRELAEMIAADVASGELALPEGREILYLAAQDRRPELEQGLSAASIPVTAAVVYRMDKISYSTDFIISAKMSSVPDAVLLYSPNAARRLFELFAAQALESPASGMAVCCLSSEVAAACPASVISRIRVAEAPNEAALLETLRSLR